MIACPGLLRRFPNQRWLFVFTACLLVQVLLLTLVFQIQLQSLIEFDKKLRRHKPNRSSDSNRYRPSQLKSIKQVHLEEPNQYENELVNEFPDCDANDPYLLSAINRAKTAFCRHTIKKTFCLHQNNQLYPTQPKNPSKCPSNGVFKHVGCFLNNRRPSVVESLVFQYKKANELKCSYLCTQLNAGYFGIENATLCHCLHQLPPTQFALNAELCSTYCDASSAVQCGGQYLISVYETGIDDRAAYGVDELMEEAVEGLASKENDIRIAFILSVNGRSTRQIKRLIRLLYHKKHFYYVHVDKQNDFLFNSLSEELNGLPNVMVTDRRFATIWGGSQLLEMLLDSFRVLSDREWDYVVNLSESDFPIKPLSSLERYLKRLEGKNFLKFHGQATDAFVRKQGLEVLFVQCENRMWRLNKQRDLPAVSISGGSDWIALHRSFVRWLIGDSVGDQVASTHTHQTEHGFVAGLRAFFNYTLLPAESFFHTVLQNSEFCDTVINNNLRLTNWKRRIGCKCQYHHIVDWCGCSPNVYLEQDWPRLQSAHDKPLFFARKFDPLVDQRIINQVESSVSRRAILAGSSASRYWQNEFHFAHDRRANHRQLDDRSHLWQSVFGLLSTIALKELLLSNYAWPRRASSYLDAVALSGVHTLIDQGKYAGTVAQVSLNCSRLPDRLLGSAQLKLDFLVLPNQAYLKPPYNDIESSAFKLVSLKVCTDYDVKEDLFRNFGCLMNSQAQLVIRHQWKYDWKFDWKYQLVSPQYSKLRGNYKIEFVIMHFVTGRIALRKEINLFDLLSTTKNRRDKEGGIVSFHFEASLRRPIEAGAWRLLLISDFRPKNLKKDSKAHSATEFSSAIDLYEIVSDMIVGQVQSRLLAETRFLIIEPNKREDSLEDELQQFWLVKDVCVHDNQTLPASYKSSIKSCLNTTWSASLPDPKSECC